MNQNAEKPGVMIYFQVMDSIETMTMEERGLLFTAILKYGKNHTEPAFENNKMLDMVWLFIKDMLDRDDAAYKKKIITKQYNKYRYEAKRHGIEPLWRDEWEEMGCPTFLQAHWNPPTD